MKILITKFLIPYEPDESDDLTWDEIRALVECDRWTPPLLFGKPDRVIFGAEEHL